MFDVMMPTALEQVGETNQVAIELGAGIFQ